jgi:acyl-ACP thioesterase
VNEPGPRRRVGADRPVRLGDVTPSARLRLDAIARYLQDLAGDDTAEIDFPEHHGWILRRLELEVGRLPALGHRLHVETRCTGVGGRWAERTTTIAESGEILVTARAVWVFVSIESGAPRPLPPIFFTAYGDAVRDRRVSARLTLPAPGTDAARTGWAWRATDLDVFGHVNNANYWAPVEEWFAGDGRGRRIERAVMEFGAGIDPGEATTIATDTTGDTATFWYLVDGVVRAAAHVALTPIA